MQSLSILCVPRNGEWAEKSLLSQPLMTAPRAFMVLSSTPAGHSYSFWPCLALHGTTSFPSSSSTTQCIALSRGCLFVSSCIWSDRQGVSHRETYFNKMAEPDLLFAVRNHFFLGAYQAAIAEAADLEGLSETEKVERDCYVYRSYIELGSYEVMALDKDDNPKFVRHIAFHIPLTL